MSKLDHSRKRITASRQEAGNDARNERAVLKTVFQPQQRQNDFELCQTFIKMSEELQLADKDEESRRIRTKMIESVQKNIKWMEENPGRCLGFLNREKFERWDHSCRKALKMLKEGRALIPMRDVGRRHRGSYDKRAPLPDWMKDRSLLPMKPPGR
jgi:hypothetical protein